MDNDTQEEEKTTITQYAVWLHVFVDADSAEKAEQAVTASLEYSTLPMSVEVDDVIEVEK